MVKSAPLSELLEYRRSGILKPAYKQTYIIKESSGSDCIVNRIDNATRYQCNSNVNATNYTKLTQTISMYKFDRLGRWQKIQLSGKDRLTRTMMRIKYVNIVIDTNETIENCDETLVKILWECTDNTSSMISGNDVICFNGDFSEVLASGNRLFADHWDVVFPHLNKSAQWAILFILWALRRAGLDRYVSRLIVREFLALI